MELEQRELLIIVNISQHKPITHPPREFVMLDYLLPFSDDMTPCNYLPNQTARLPMSLPTKPTQPQHFDQLMESGYRRSGIFYYFTNCPNCCACQPIRLAVAEFRPSRSQRRVWIRAEGIRFQWGTPQVDERRVDLFNRHRGQRGLAQSETRFGTDDYRSFLIDTPNPSFELSLWRESELIAVSIVDAGQTSLSAVYCYFDPQYSRLSPGTLSILQQIQIAKESGRQWLYLGYYVADNPHLSYKANFRPHQRRIGGRWEDFS